VDSLSKRHQDLLKDYKAHVQTMKDCVAKNQEVFDLIMGEESNMFENHEDVYPKVSHEVLTTFITLFEHLNINYIINKNNLNPFDLTCSKFKMHYPNHNLRLLI